jgi:hypothetical protein
LRTNQSTTPPKETNFNPIQSAREHLNIYPAYLIFADLSRDRAEGISLQSNRSSRIQPPPAAMSFIFGKRKTPAGYHLSSSSSSWIGKRGPTCSPALPVLEIVEFHLAVSNYFTCSAARRRSPPPQNPTPQPVTPHPSKPTRSIWHAATPSRENQDDKGKRYDTIFFKYLAVINMQK